jgi:tRNA(fMet)-specific endonuclease VapC
MAEKATRPFDDLIADDDDVVIAAVTAAELLVGIELASKRHRSPREAFVELVLQTIPIEPFDLEVAREHARLLAWTRGSGQPRGAHDLIIAATAVARGRIVVSGDVRGFEGLPAVSVRAT